MEEEEKKQRKAVNAGAGSRFGKAEAVCLKRKVHGNAKHSLTFAKSELLLPLPPLSTRSTFPRYASHMASCLRSTSTSTSTSSRSSMSAADNVQASILHGVANGPWWVSNHVEALSGQSPIILMLLCYLRNSTVTLPCSVSLMTPEDHENVQLKPSVQS